MPRDVLRCRLVQGFLRGNLHGPHKGLVCKAINIIRQAVFHGFALFFIPPKPPPAGLTPAGFARMVSAFFRKDVKTQEINDL